MKSQPINKFEGVKVDLSIEEAIKFVDGDRNMIDRTRDHISGHLRAAGISIKEEKVASEKKKVRCEFCNELFLARGLKIHQKKCRKNQRHSIVMRKLIEMHIPSQPRRKPGYTRGPTVEGMGPCSKCSANEQLMCYDRGRSGRHVLCEIPDELDLKVEYGRSK